MKNTAELNINLKVDLGEDKSCEKSTLEVYTKIDGEEKYYSKIMPFVGSAEDLLSEINKALILIEKDGRFGA